MRKEEIFETALANAKAKDAENRIERENLEAQIAALKDAGEEANHNQISVLQKKVDSLPTVGWNVANVTNAAIVFKGVVEKFEEVQTRLSSYIKLGNSTIYLRAEEEKGSKREKGFAAIDRMFNL